MYVLLKYVVRYFCDFDLKSDVMQANKTKQIKEMQVLEKRLGFPGLPKSTMMNNELI